MILDAQVTRVEEARTGVAANGLPYCRRTIVVAFQEGGQDGNVLNQAMAIDLSGEDAGRQYVQFQQVSVELRFSVSAYKGRIYQDVRGKIIQPATSQNPVNQSTQQSQYGR